MKKITQNFMLIICAFLFFGNVKSQPSMTSSVLTQPCNNNGQIGVSVTGLTPPISYTYSNWQANQTIVHSAVAGYTDNLQNIAAYYNSWTGANIWWVTASDGSQWVSDSVYITSPFSFSTSVSNGLCPNPSTLQASGFTGGTSPYTCAWTNLNTNQLFSTNPATVTNGQYGLVVTDAAGCMVAMATGSSGLWVQSNVNYQVSISGSPANCTNGTATVNASTAPTPVTYLWTNNATSQSVGGLSSGPLNCVITDGQGCQSTAYYYISQSVNLNFNPTIANATCLQNDGSITGFVAGGTAPYTFNWSNFATTQNLSNLPGGSYSVLITDAVGCTGVGYAYVGVTTPINVTYNTTASSCTASTGAATIAPTGGTSPYTMIWYTFPSTTSGASISNKSSGTYGFKVTDAAGCVQTGAAVIPPISAVSANIYAPSIICPATTGTVFVSVTGSSPPYTYQWSNSSTGSSISNVSSGYYSCTITNSVGCSVVKNAYLGVTSNINLGTVSTPVDCKFATNGAITANATGGTSPYTYTWSTNQTGPSITGIGMGNYYVYVTDANGCTANTFVTVGNSATNNACYCTITGVVYTDLNSNCIQNSGENGVANILMHCSGYGYASTDANGVYSFQVPTGSYTITEIVQQIYPLAPCQTNNQVVSVVSATNCQTVVDFANGILPISDLRIVATNMNFPIQGNTYNQRLIVTNDGTLIENNIKLGYTHDGQLGFTSSSPWNLIQPNATTYPNWYRINSGFSTLIPSLSSVNNLYYNVPTNIPLNTLLTFNDTVAKNLPLATNWLLDNTPWNNVSTHYANVVGSYDPNFKEVSPKGTGPFGLITTKDSVLTYVIHFQNTGSYFAQNIVVVDTLDANLNMLSFKPSYGDHVFDASMSENGVLKFSFPGINLPWKDGYGDALSSGMFSYTVKLKKGLALGSKIHNKAAIYFDYNAPIITNTTENTIGAKGPTALVEADKNKSQDLSVLFPNPASQAYYLRLNSASAQIATMRLFDISGREILSQEIDLLEGENVIAGSAQQLQNGIYFLNVKAGEITLDKKLIVSH